MESGTDIDASLLEKFESSIWSKVPHIKDGKIVGATPLTDITQDLTDCAKTIFNTNLGGDDLKIYGKFDSVLPSGSIKVRPAVHIIHNAISTGKLKSGQMVIEATSGNFGIALGQLSGLGITIVSLVSRKLQEGVFAELRNEDIRIMDLDMDICPAPGMKDNPNVLAAKATAVNIRSQLTELGFDPTVFDGSIKEIESLLAAQDIINLAKFLAKIYGVFCPEQYDNDLNIDVHRTITAAEIDQQLHEHGESLGDFQVVCSFGTGGTSGGLSRYIADKYRKKSVHVVFPSAGQDVAGIRTKAKADGLRYYRPDDYAREHEIDFSEAKRLMKFFVSRGHDIGESSALELYAAMQMAVLGHARKFIVMIADGVDKYKKALEEQRKQVSLQDAASEIDKYDKIIWVHAQYTPREEGVEMIAKSLGVDKSKISVPKAATVGKLLQTRQVPQELGEELSGGKSLLVCMAGNTSLMAVNVLADSGIVAESLDGGITGLPEGIGKSPGEYVKAATE